MGVGGWVFSAVLRVICSATCRSSWKVTRGCVLAAIENPNSWPNRIAIRRPNPGAICGGTCGGTSAAVSTATCGSRLGVPPLAAVTSLQSAGCSQCPSPMRQCPRALRASYQLPVRSWQWSDSALLTSDIQPLASDMDSAAPVGQCGVRTGNLRHLRNLRMGERPFDRTQGDAARLRNLRLLSLTPKRRGFLTLGDCGGNIVCDSGNIRAAQLPIHRRQQRSPV